MPPNPQFLDQVVNRLHEAAHIRWPEIPHGNHGVADPIVFWMYGFLDGVRFTYDYPRVAAKMDRRTFDKEKDQPTHRAVDFLAGAMADVLPTPHFQSDEEHKGWLTERLAEVIMGEVATHPIMPKEVDLDTGHITWETWSPTPPIDYDEWMDRGAD